MEEFNLWILTPLLLTVFTVVYALYANRKRHSNLPPGPFSFPLVGNFPQLFGKNIVEVFESYRKKYGDIFTIQLFHKTIIVINGVEELKNTFIRNSKVFSDRPESTELGAEGSYKEMGTGLGIIFANGDLLKHNKQFSIHAMRDFGMGKTQLQDKILEELSHYTNLLESREGRSFDSFDIVKVAVSNVLCSVLFGHRFEYDDPKILDIIHRMDESAQAVLHMKADWLKYIPGDPFRVQRSHDNCRVYDRFFTDEVRKHYEGFDSNHNRDVVDAYLHEMKNENGKKSSLKSEKEIAKILHDLFIAGMKATAASIQFGLLYLIRHPDVQEKILEEINSVTSSNGTVDINDRKHMPFTDATIKEILRLGNVAPFGFPHATTEEVTLKGYKIPKSTMIIPNLTSVLMDETVWGDSKKFIPSRFVNSKKSDKTDVNSTFSFGPRSCPGEEMAKTLLYLIVTTTVQKFKLFPAEGEEMPVPGSCSATIPEPYPFKMRVVKRMK